MNIYRKHLLVAAICLFSICSHAQVKPNKATPADIAYAIFSAWQTGEAGNGYHDFKTHLDRNTFAYFSHPLTGNYTGKEAYEKLMTLVEEREKMPNHLIFLNIVRYQINNSFCLQFDSEGKIAGGSDYKGYNIIQLEIKNGKLIGFREYFGYINPLWFK